MKEIFIFLFQYHSNLFPGVQDIDSKFSVSSGNGFTLGDKPLPELTMTRFTEAYA